MLLGGTSDIGRAIVDALVVAGDARPSCWPAGGPTTMRRRRSCARRGVDRRRRALRRHRHRPPTTALVARPRRSATATSTSSIVAFGQLGDAGRARRRPGRGGGAGRRQLHRRGERRALAVAAQFRRQGHGRLVVLSSVAGERVRKANFVYGSSKAGLDGFAQGLGDALAGTGASVLVVRPGFVHSKMTEGMKAAPFATTPAAVAAATVKALRARPAHGVGAGGAAPAVRRLPPPPGALWRRLPS